MNATHKEHQSQMTDNDTYLQKCKTKTGMAQQEQKNLRDSLKNCTFKQRSNVPSFCHSTIDCMAYLNSSSLYEGRSKSFEPDYLPQDFWAKKMLLALATVFY